MNGQLSSELLRLSAHVAQEPADPVGFIKRIREQRDLQGIGGLGRVLRRDLTQQVPLLVLMENREVVGRHDELLREDGRDRIEQPGETCIIDRFGNRGGEPFADVAVDLRDEIEHRFVLA